MRSLRQNKGLQLNTTEMRGVDDPQLALPMMGQGTRPKPHSYSLDQVRALRSSQAAVEMAVRHSGLLDKEIQLSLAIDKGHWSRISSGDLDFPFGKVNRFNVIVGNKILTQYLVEQDGDDASSIRPHYSDLEQQLAATQAEVADLRRALGLVLEVKGAK